MNNNDKKRIQVKTMENLTDEELNQLIEGLKKIDGFDFSISSAFIKIGSIAQPDDAK